jgi:hypothetical protein
MTVMHIYTHVASMGPSALGYIEHTLLFGIHALILDFIHRSKVIRKTKRDVFLFATTKPGNGFSPMLGYTPQEKDMFFAGTCSRPSGRY